MKGLEGKGPLWLMESAADAMFIAWTTAADAVEIVKNIAIKSEQKTDALIFIPSSRIAMLLGKYA